jgi:hypothetical protein|tara:strand:- start:58 stop:348 length:291 start_codon:yes stop_codon:yes gene_type:complete
MDIAYASSATADEVAAFVAAVYPREVSFIIYPDDDEIERFTIAVVKLGRGANTAPLCEQRAGLLIEALMSRDVPGCARGGWAIQFAQQRIQLWWNN